MLNLLSHPVVLRIGFLIALLLAWLPTDTKASNLPQCTGDYWHNCQGTFTANGNKYIGEFKDGKMNGQGALKTATDGEFVGEFKDGKMNGRGTFTFADGKKYVGEWKENKFEGSGVYYAADGSFIQSGIWLKNKFIREENVKPLSSVKSIFKYSEYKDIIDGKIYCGTIISPDKIYDNKKQFIDYLFITKQDDYKFTISVKSEPSQLFFNLLSNLTKLGSGDLNKEILVEYRFDQLNGLSEKWFISSSQKSIERPMSYDFINSLIEANTLLIRTFDAMGNQQVSKFSFGYDRSAILQTINNCASIEDLKKPDIFKKLDLSLEEKFKIQSNKDKSLSKNSISNFENNLLEAMKVAEEAAQRKAIEEANREAIVEIEATLRKEIEEKIAERLIIAEMRVRFLKERLITRECKPLERGELVRLHVNRLSILPDTKQLIDAVDKYFEPILQAEELPDAQLSTEEELIINEVDKYLGPIVQVQQNDKQHDKVEETAEENIARSKTVNNALQKMLHTEDEVYFLEGNIATCKEEKIKAEQKPELKVKVAELTGKALEISEMEGTPKALHQQNCEFVYQRAYPNRLYDRGKSCR